MKKEGYKPKFNSVWVIDDCEIDLFLAERILKTHAKVEDLYLEVNVLKALHRLQQIEDTKDYPELLLLDMKMPLMNGEQFLAEMHKMEHFKPKTSCVMLLSAFFDFREGKDIVRIAGNYPFVKICSEKPLQVRHLAEMHAELSMMN